MFTLDTYVLVKCTHFIVWIYDGHRGYSLRPISLCFALLCFAFSDHLLPRIFYVRLNVIIGRIPWEQKFPKTFVPRAKVLWNFYFQEQVSERVSSTHTHTHTHSP